MKIGELSRQVGVPVETIRYYEKIGLMAEPARSDSGYRDYQHVHLERLRFIRRCRSLDMAQDEIRELLRLADQSDADCGEVDELLARHLSHVRERLRELANLEQTLEQLQQACSQNRTVSECGILGGLSSDPPPESSPGKHNHIPGTHGTR
ncbi:Cd(II)/Pb(II)-responsive transcriptional regulator [Kineobactrum salinum]|uniref:Cd(II)/Pb(II)-responsive transcriptional regulator n=1 Tax=Kineobactrum salinum TaxID=2708301 RepID=A0A6C0U278_9GAMM|nr:Cd(II)/Pb(II)-responsive transcriptional regulator [Kineobactrum salinum]QIB66181.1 Cd(II)/Pb(II)-responsive transcriptional regulator [Kineobactrum salinum]